MAAFHPGRLDASFRAADAIPMRLRRKVIGALNLFQADTSPLNDADVAAAQSLADIATTAILQHHAAADAHRVNEQLNHALDSRVVIEQAKGVIAERRNISMEQAFTLLRTHARDNNQRLAEVATRVTAGALNPSALDKVTRRAADPSTI